MELRITNLGRIREAKLDIRPLTIFVGPNHTNKTWTAYSLYGIARSLAHSSFSVRQPEVNHRDLSFGASAEWQAKIESIAEELFRTLSEAPGAQIKSIISRRDVIEGMDSSAVNFSIDPGGLAIILGVPHAVLPDARAQLTLNQREFNASTYSTMEVTYSPSNRALAQILERQVIQGSINFRNDVNGSSRPGPQSGFSHTAHDGIELALHASASIVRSLAGLDVYLKHFCDENGLLVIDEPEMNAHPEAQLKIIEFLAMLAHFGVRVVLTTHSPYIVDHLSNLMQASRLGEKSREAIAPQFKLGRPEAFLSPEEISVYLFQESGVVEDILDRDQGVIDLTSFSRPTEYMANLVNEIWKASDEEVCESVEQGNAV